MNSRDDRSKMATRALLAAVPQFLHPAKVAVIEALVWMEEPLSPTQLHSVFENPDWNLSLVSYHVKELAKKDILEEIRSQQVRGVMQRFYDIQKPF